MRPKPSPIFIRIAKWIAISVALYTIIGFLILPIVTRSVLSNILSEQLQRSVTIMRVTINPYALTFGLHDLIIKDREGSDILFSLKELHLNLETASILNKGLILKEARIVNPYVNIIRYEDSSYSISDLMETEKEPSPSESEPLKFSVNNIQLLDGSIDLNDMPKDTMHRVKNITVSIPMISNLPYLVDIFVQPAFKATINDTPFMIEGNTKPFSDSLKTVLRLDIEDFDIPYYLEYAPFRMNFSLLSGTIDARNNITFSQYTDKPPSLTLSGDISLKDLKAVDKNGDPLINLPSVDIAIAPSKLISGEVRLLQVSVSEPEIHLTRNNEGLFNMQSLIASENSETTAADKDEEETAASFLLMADGIDIKNGKVFFKDETTEKSVQAVVDQLQFSAENFTTEKENEASIQLSLRLNDKGMVSTNGSISIAPLKADLNLDLQDIDITPFQPYFTDRVNIQVTSGSFMTKGSLSFNQLNSGELDASYTGDASLLKFDTLSKINAGNLLKWDILNLAGLDFGISPLHLSIKAVSLSDYYALLHIDPEGNLNLQRIFKKEDTETESPAPDTNVEDISSSAKMDINIDNVTLQNGTVSFSDQQIKPSYSVNLLEIGGRVSGLSSKEGSRADVMLMGKLENYAPLKIKGEINPLAKDLFVDLKVDFNAIDLSPLTPYSHKFIGYTIQKGKLSLGLQYLIDKKKLDSTNNLFLDQFTLGEKVDSPDATSLPVKLAIALLKNGKGEINLDLPVTGEIDDPEFRVGGIVVKMLLNILVKAATSPFALLGALVGGGEELSYIDFDNGSSAIKDGEKAKLDKLVTALSDRPSLNVDIKGFVDIENDRESIRQQTFDNKLKAQKLKDMVGKSDEALSLENIIIEPEEFEKYLAKAYKEEEFPKPRNMLGLAKKLPPEEMEKLILTHIEINDEELRQLASKRSFNVIDYFLASGQIAAERVFLLEPESLQPEAKENVTNSRVDFSLK